MIFKEDVNIGIKDIWKENKISNKGILNYLEDVAAHHSDSVGYGVQDIKNTNLTWILLDWKLKVIKRPEYGQTLNINTWSRKIAKCWAYRDFEVYDKKQNLCIIASSKWLLMNSSEKKIAKIEPKVADAYKTEINKNVFAEEIEKLKEPSNFDSQITYEVKRSDIDVIGHMHNLYYLDLAYEALPKDVYYNKVFDEINIMYKREIKLGDKVLCKYSYCKENNTHVIVIKSQDESILHAIVQLK